MQNYDKNTCVTSEYLTGLYNIIPAYLNISSAPSLACLTIDSVFTLHQITSFIGRNNFSELYLML